MTKVFLFAFGSLMTLSVGAVATQATSPLSTTPADPSVQAQAQAQVDTATKAATEAMAQTQGAAVQPAAGVPPTTQVQTTTQPQAQCQAQAPSKAQDPSKKSRKSKPQPYVVYPERVLPISITYRNQPSEIKNSLADIKDGLSNFRSAYNAIPVQDQNYETRLFSYKISPYIPLSLYSQVVASHACDIEGHGPCIVVEKDTATGAVKTRAYIIGARKSFKSSGTNVARVEIDKKKFEKQLVKLLSDKLDKPDGIYIYSSAYSGEEAQALDQFFRQYESETTASAP